MIDQSTKPDMSANKFIWININKIHQGGPGRGCEHGHKQRQVQVKVKYVDKDDIMDASKEGYKADTSQMSPTIMLIERENS